MQLHVPRLPGFYRIIDFCMLPIMFLLGWLRRDAMQETHAWHVWRDFRSGDINQALSVKYTGSDRTFHRHYVFLFHVPMLGGWKKYLVVQPHDKKLDYRIGWIVYDKKRLKRVGVQRLIVHKQPIRILSGPANYSGYFFAVDVDGKQIKLEKIGEGMLGDGKYPNTRLF